MDPAAAPSEFNKVVLLASVGLVSAALAAYWLIVKKTLHPQKKVPLKLIKKEEVSWDTRKFTFALPSSRHVLGLPIGQHVFISANMANPRTAKDKKYVARAYTPTSNDDTKGIVELVIKVYFKETVDKFPDGGWMSQYLNDMAIGDTLDFRGPVGKLNYLGNGVFSIGGKTKTYKKIGMVAGGTGITPMYQIMKYALAHNEPLEFGLLFANKSEKDILLQDELDAIAKDPRVKIAYTIDAMEPGWKGYTGFVSEAMISETLPAPGPDTLALTCGPPVMVERCVQPAYEKLGYQNTFAY
jgi:NAD(P)H-flavin reductase